MPCRTKGGNSEAFNVHSMMVCSEVPTSDQVLLSSCRTQGSNIEAFSVHPGMIITNLTRHSPLLKAASWMGYLLMKSPQQVS